MAPYKLLESADALDALYAVYFSKFPRLGRMKRSYRRKRHSMVSEIGEAVNNHAQGVDNKVVGRQAFLLDEPSRQTGNDGMPRSPLAVGGGDISCSREEGKRLLRLSWGVDNNGRDVGLEYQKPYGLHCMPTKLVMTPTGSLVRLDYVSSQGLGFGCKRQRVEWEVNMAADEAYREYIDSRQCCSLGGWLNS